MGLCLEWLLLSCLLQLLVDSLFGLTLAMNRANLVVAFRVLYPRLWPITVTNAKLRIEGWQQLVEEEVGVRVSSSSCACDIG